MGHVDSEKTSADRQRRRRRSRAARAGAGGRYPPRRVVGLGLEKSFGGRVLFRDVTFRLLPGRRVALVGGNGAGKTTLLEILVGLGEQDAGEVSRPKDLTVGYSASGVDRGVDRHGDR